MSHFIWLHSEGGRALQAPGDVPIKLTRTAFGDMIFFFLQMRKVRLAQEMICPGTPGCL